jgi:NhaC family Na+:H+ antiporter
MTGTVARAIEPVMILLLIGALTGAWTVSGIIPAMVYYGVEFVNPSALLPATVVVCSLISVVTGSSWTTVATVGVAIAGIGEAFGLNSGMVAGAIISGAYFGDKLSPLSDTTNLAAAVAGTNLFTHIRYMIYTTLPAWVATLIIFSIIGPYAAGETETAATETIRVAIASNFNVNPLLLAAPALLVAVIVKRTPAVPAMIAGTALGLASAVIFQSELMHTISSQPEYDNLYKTLIKAVSGEFSAVGTQSEIASLASSSGMTGMLGTVFLIVAAMIFGGAMESSGCLETITNAIRSLIKGRVSLILCTLLSGVIFNLTACDQYLSIVVPGRMLSPLYDLNKYSPEVLSRALEDSATVTSPLIPWNSCGATQSKILAITVAHYLPYCFFNMLSPVFNILETVCNYKIRRRKN